MNLDDLKKRLSDTAQSVLESEQVQRVMSDERVQSAVASAIEVGRQAREEVEVLGGQLRDLVAQQGSGPAADDTAELKRELDEIRDGGGESEGEGDSESEA